MYENGKWTNLNEIGINKNIQFDDNNNDHHDIEIKNGIIIQWDKT